MFRFLIVLGTGILLTLNLQAETKKYIVTVKSPQIYKMLSAQAKGFSTFGAFSNSQNQFQFLSEGGGKISQAFDNLDMVVVESDNAAQIEMLKSSPDVAVEEEMIIPEPKPIGNFSTFDNGQRLSTGPLDTPWGIKAVKAPEAWQDSNFGEGVRVMVLDTGIDKDHPALADRFEKGQNFMQRTDDPPYEFFDVNGHGTHVAGTIAAAGINGGLVGVAPKAKVLSARVCGGGCSSIAIIAGVDWGISEKVDVMNLSLGGPFPSQAAMKAYERAEAANIVVVAASGNDGNAVISYPAAFETTVAVGAVDSKLEKALFSQWGPQLDIVAPGVDVFSSVPVGMGKGSNLELVAKNGTVKLESSPMQGSGLNKLTGEVVYVGLAKTEDIETMDLTGKIALAIRGEIAFGDKAANALAQGAIAVVIFNHEDGVLNGTLGDGIDLGDKPVLGITKIDGENIMNEMAAGSDPVSLTVAVEKTDYMPMQGTSMASPHTAGVVALIRAAAPQLDAVSVKSVLKSTATKLSGANDANQLGSGLINADEAVRQALVKALGGELLLTGTN